MPKIIVFAEQHDNNDTYFYISREWNPDHFNGKQVQVDEEILKQWERIIKEFVKLQYELNDLYEVS